MKQIFSIIFSLMIPLALFSCFPKDLSGSSFSRDEVGRAQTIRIGTVQSMRHVKIQGGQNAGTAIGTLAGAIAGSQVGGGSGETLGILGGAAVGAAAGGAVQQGIGNKQGIEITIQMDDEPNPVSIVQQYQEGETFNIGDRVRVIYGSERIRVAH